MQPMPRWLKPISVSVAVLIAAILLAGIVLVPYTSSRPPEGYNQSRLHWNTKNSTRFDGADLATVASRVSTAVYPAIQPETTPDLVIVYAPDDWQGGLAAAPLLRPLNAVLLPQTDSLGDEIGRLQPNGSDALDGAQVLLLNDATLEGDFSGATHTTDEIIALRSEIGDPPQHAILVNADDSATALLAAPWAANSGDLVIFDAADVPSDVPLFALGSADADSAVRIDGGSPAETAVDFAVYDNPDYPLFGWGYNDESLTGYRAYTLARQDDPAMALLSANLNVRGKPGPLLWANERDLPAVENNHIFAQRAAFWNTPSEGPFHHFFILGDTAKIAFPAQSQADYAVEMSPYIGKTYGMSGVDALAALWVALGVASAAWIAFHASKFLPFQNWVMRLAWPLLALLIGPFGIPFYYLAHHRPIIRKGKMIMWDRPLWLQGLVATVSAVGFGASIMIASGYLVTLFGTPLYPSQLPVLFLLGTPMIVIMIVNYVAAVLISWLLFQTPMLAMFYGLSYRATLMKALPMVVISMTFAALAMNPGMWVLMMWDMPMMPTEESILWIGIMFFTGFLAFLMALPANYVLIRRQRKSGLM